MSDNPYDAPQHLGTKPTLGLAPGQSPSNGLAITSMVLGILSLVFNSCCSLLCCFFTLLGAALGIAAIITGFIALNKVKDGTGGGRGMAMAGLICGIVALLMGIGLYVLSFAIQMPNIMQEIQQMQ